MASAYVIIDIPRMQWRFSDQGQYKCFAECPAQAINVVISEIEVLGFYEEAITTPKTALSKVKSF